jgi:PTH1 family peptidyl-tRNA hydrolase
MIELAAFFVNPGPEHKGNRHNAGWHLAQKLSFYKELEWRKKFKGTWADIEGERLLPFGASVSSDPALVTVEKIEGSVTPAGKIHFLLPATYMNRSGDSVKQAAAFFKIKPESVIVIHDELELPLGTISLKFGGGLGGHNGLRSMKDSFGTADFWRLRIGIGRPDDRLPGQGGPQGSGRGIFEWVLSDFTSEEHAVLEPTLEAGADLLLKAIIYGPDKFLPLWAKKKLEAL